MKTLFHTPTQTLRAYPRNDDLPVVGLSDEFEVFEVFQEAEPEYDREAQRLEPTETINVSAKTVTRGWEVKELPPKIPGWTNVQAFIASFTMLEIAAVSLSTDPTIAALRLTLSTWLGRVEVPDLRVQTGLNKMVELGIISADRKAEIEAQAT